MSVEVEASEQVVSHIYEVGADAIEKKVGGQFTRRDAFLIRSALLQSLIIIVCALLPPLLALFEILSSTIWRASSFVAAGLIATFTVAWPTIIRQKTTSLPLSNTAKAYHGVQLLTALLLLAIAFGAFAQSAQGYFAVGLTIFMITSWISILLSLEILFHNSESA